MRASTLKGWEFNPLISADGNVLLFTALNRKGGFGLGDIYLCHREGERWYPPQNLGPRINTRNDEYHPSVSADRRKLFFVRRIIGELPRPGDIYHIELNSAFLKSIRQRCDVRPDRFAQRFQVVPAFEDRDDSPLGVAVGHLHYLFRHLSKIAVFKQQPA